MAPSGIERPSRAIEGAGPRPLGDPGAQREPSGQRARISLRARGSPSELADLPQSSQLLQSSRSPFPLPSAAALNTRRLSHNGSMAVFLTPSAAAAGIRSRRPWGAERLRSLSLFHFHVPRSSRSHGGGGGGEPGAATRKQKAKNAN